jgi:hypothetical protein
VRACVYRNEYVRIYERLRCTVLKKILLEVMVPVLGLSCACAWAEDFEPQVVVAC